MSEPKPAGEALTATGVLDRLLAYASSPWKAAVILVAIVICGAGWVVWTERGRIADAVLKSAASSARLDDQAFIADVVRLLRDTRAEMALLVEIHLIDNVMIDRIGIDADGNRWIPSTGPQQALQPASSMPLLVQFLANEVVCTNTENTVNDDVKALHAKGFQRVCMVAVPPILGVNVGALLVAWHQPPSPQVETRAGYAMRAAALRYATW